MGGAMIAVRIDPLEWHNRNHFRGYTVPMDSCWYCQRQVAICKTKRRYPDVETASKHAHRQNVEENWKQPVLPYGCRYCDGYHLATARGKHRERKAEKRRRKWIVRQIGEGTNPA